MPDSNVTSSRGDTRSIKASNCGRASIVQRTPFVARTAVLIERSADASSGSSGCILTKAFDVPPLVERCMVAEQCNFRSFGKTLNLQNFVWFAWRRDLANGEILDKKSASPERR